MGQRKEKIVDFTKTETGKRSLAYIEARAKELGVEYSLEESHRNRELLCLLWDGCLEFDQPGSEFTAEVLQDLCDKLLDASKVMSLGGIQHKEPESLEDYERLFNTPMTSLGLCDVPYVPPEGIDLKISWTVSSDDEAVLKNLPGVQLSIPWAELSEA